MEIIEEKELFKTLAAKGIRPDELGAPAYVDDDSVRGFDFSNLEPGRAAPGALDYVNPGDRVVETAMVEALFQIIHSLGLFPLYLVAVDDEWAPEEPEELKGMGHLSERETEALGRVSAMNGGMNVLKLTAEELETASAIIAPQMTLFSNRCVAMDGEGRFIALFSEDDEVSLNTTDEKLYHAARKLALEIRKTAPFDMIFAEDSE